MAKTNVSFEEFETKLIQTLFRDFFEDAYSNFIKPEDVNNLNNTKSLAILLDSVKPDKLIIPHKDWSALGLYSNYTIFYKAICELNLTIEKVIYLVDLDDSFINENYKYILGLKASIAKCLSIFNQQALGFYYKKACIPQTKRHAQEIQEHSNQLVEEYKSEYNAIQEDLQSEKETKNQISNQFSPELKKAFREYFHKKGIKIGCMHFANEADFKLGEIEFKYTAIKTILRQIIKGQLYPGKIERVYAKYFISCLPSEESLSLNTASEILYPSDNLQPGSKHKDKLIEFVLNELGKGTE